MDAGQLPADFYGLNFLGRPAFVSVLGESPTGGVGTVGATATGGLGASGAKSASASPASSGPGSAPSSSNALQTVSQIAQGAGAADSAIDVGNAASQGSSASAPFSITGPLSEPVPTYPGISLSDPLMKEAFPEFGKALSTQSAQTAAPSAAEAGSGTGAAAGAGAGASAGAESLAGPAAGPLGSLYMYLANQAAQALPPATRSKAEIAATTAQPWLSLAFPDFWQAAFSGNLGNWFSGKPPAIDFPAGTWEQISSQVGSALPQPLPVPNSLSPDQRKSIEDLNTLIDETRRGYTGKMPSYLGGKQSGESWQNTMNTMTQDIQKRFGQIQQLYPKAYESILNNFKSSLPSNMPQGAPQGLIQDVQGPAQAVQEALAAGDYNKAAQLMANSPASSAMERYRPQLESAQSQGIDFLRQGKKKDEE